MKSNEELRELASIAVFSSKKVLNDGNYTPVPNDLFRVFLGDLKDKYDGITARDCVIMWLFLYSYVNRDPQNSFYMWAYPTVAQISESTGIHRDRIKKLTDILVSENLLKTKRVPYKGHTKKLFMPYYGGSAQ